MMHLMMSMYCTTPYTMRIGQAVPVARMRARGIETTHRYALSNRKVIHVLPPERRVK